MRLPLQEARNNFELHIAGEPLGKRLSNGTLLSVDENGKHYPLVSRDISVRLNNWDNLRASILTQTTISGFALGVCVTLLLIGLVQFFRHGKMTGDTVLCLFLALHRQWEKE